MLDSTNQTATVLKAACGGGDVRDLPLNILVLAILHLLAWADGPRDPLDLSLLSAKELGSKLGKAAVFLVGDRLLHRRLGKKSWRLCKPPFEA